MVVDVESVAVTGTSLEVFFEIFQIQILFTLIQNICYIITF